MGVFSFLTRARRQEPAAQAATGQAVTAAPGSPAGAAATAAATPANPHAEGWNVGSLTAPPAGVSPDSRLEVGPPDPVATSEIEPKVVAALSTIFDPEIPINIYELGLIYGVTVDARRRVAVRMTLTSPACPSAQQLPSEALYKVKAVAGVTDATVDVVWEPPWSKDMMSEAAKLSLGIF
jgi:FeS assembly SUF system protein